MKYKLEYNHLNAVEFLTCHKKDQFDQIKKVIEDIDANKYLKRSGDKTKTGKVLYSQKKINKEFKRLMLQYGWQEKKIPYYVTGDLETTKVIVKEKDSAIQKKIIQDKGLVPFSTNNQVDFNKNRIAIEVQFGKYFSVAYDLHVKHTFFFLRDEIDVGVEIIPTHAMMKRMDTGVPWFENEVTNVVREGRNNPGVPFVMIGVEPEVLIPEPGAAEKAVAAKNNVEKQRESLVRAKSKIDAKNEKIEQIQGQIKELLESISQIDDSSAGRESAKKIKLADRLEKKKEILEKEKAKIKKAKIDYSAKESELEEAIRESEYLESEARRAEEFQARVPDIDEDESEEED